MENKTGKNQKKANMKMKMRKRVQKENQKKKKHRIMRPNQKMKFCQEFLLILSLD